MAGGRRTPRGVQALQGGRRPARQAVLPVRDVPRHGDEPRRRVRDHRARVHLEVDGRRQTASDYTGWLGAVYTDKADPGTTNFVPRPDWYFYFLFYLLRIFKWPESVILGTIGIPTICLILLLALPFVDLRTRAAALAAPGRDRRRDPRRPLDGRAHVQGRDREGVARERGRPGSCRCGRRSRASRTTSRRSRARSSSPQSGCYIVPHVPRHGLARTSARRTSRAIGASGQGAPSSSRRTSAIPRKYNNPIMPVFGNLGSPANIRNIGIFLAASKGAK